MRVTRFDWSRHKLTVSAIVPTNDTPAEMPKKTKTCRYLIDAITRPESVRQMIPAKHRIPVTRMLISNRLSGMRARLILATDCWYSSWLIIPFKRTGYVESNSVRMHPSKRCDNSIYHLNVHSLGLNTSNKRHLYCIWIHHLAKHLTETIAEQKQKKNVRKLLSPSH